MASINQAGLNRTDILASSLYADIRRADSSRTTNWIRPFHRSCKQRPKFRTSIFATTHSYEILLSPTVVLVVINRHTLTYDRCRHAHCRVGAMLHRPEMACALHAVCSPPPPPAGHCTTSLIERTPDDDDCRCCWAASIFCCTYSNGAVSFNLCEDGSDCPVLSGYTLVKSSPTSSCSICTGSNSNKTRPEAQSKHKMRVK